MVFDSFQYNDERAAIFRTLSAAHYWSFFLPDRRQHTDEHRDPNLSFDCVDRVFVEALDPQMLPDPFEEQSTCQRISVFHPVASDFPFVFFARNEKLDLLCSPAITKAI
jgi:hypothetical protein